MFSNGATIGKYSSLLALTTTEQNIRSSLSATSNEYLTTTTGSDAYIKVNKSGLYLVTMHCEFTSPSGTGWFGLYKGSSYIQDSRVSAYTYSENGGEKAQAFSNTLILNLSAGDIIRMKAWKSTDDSKSVKATVNNYLSMYPIK